MQLATNRYASCKNVFLDWKPNWSKREAELINLKHLQERISGLEAELSKREIELHNLKRMHFGQSSEKMKKPESLEPLPLFPEYDGTTVEAIDNTLPPNKSFENHRCDRGGNQAAQGEEKD